MKKKIVEFIEIPQGVSCEVQGQSLKIEKNGEKIIKEIKIPETKVKIEEGKITLECKEGNKNNFKIIKTYIKHIKNIFEGLDKKFLYKLASCNVHFPMTLKVDKNYLLINNFLGEKNPRKALILEGVEVSIKGSDIILSGRNKELVGQTAANFEKATHIKNRDRRVFQDGIYIIEKGATQNA